MFDTSTPFRIQRIKRRVLAKDGLSWSDLMVVCAICDLCKESFNVTAEDVITFTKLNRCWVYASLRKLNAKQYIAIQERHDKPFIVSTTGWGTFLLTQAQEAYEGRNTFLHFEE